MGRTRIFDELGGQDLYILERLRPMETVKMGLISCVPRRITALPSPLALFEANFLLSESISALLFEVLRVVSCHTAHFY